MTDASSFASQMEFRYTWRPYQERVIKEMSAHLRDGRLHIVAAPGSGKTILGLEALRRINRPTLILSPTLTIRDQWIDRLTAMFLPEGAATPDWISTDIRSPAAITSITYQALHMACTGESEEADEEDTEEESGPARRARRLQKVDVAGLLRNVGVQTLVLDECHHLRTEWWRTLGTVIGALEHPVIVSLTATPPYDVPPAEWDRYLELCGPIDGEIPVPELVEDRNLCPHQDYVYLSRPSPDERALVTRFRADARALLATLAADAAFAAAIESHPFLARPGSHVDAILEQTPYFSAMAVFLAQVCGRPSVPLMRCMGLDPNALPDMTGDRWGELLTGCLYADEDAYPAHRETLTRIRRDLERIGAVDRRVVSLRTTPKLARLLAASVSKLDSIREIVTLEHAALGERLRQVILTDFIRAADMPKQPGDEKPLQRLGVVPVFELLRREGPADLRLGILCGSMAVVPAASLPLVRECAHSLGLDPDAVVGDALPHDERFVQLAIAGPDDRRMVRLITEVFARGGITTLVGTKSLLGEGWDAPTVNSLILASFVGSYMLSNQMRGRAIRTDKADPEKAATIWHLACVVDDDDADGLPYAGEDWEALARRFAAFVGPSRTEPVIASGIERLALGAGPFTDAAVRTANDTTRQAATDRAALRQAWDTALGLARRHELVHEVRTAPGALPRRQVLRDAATTLALQGAGVLACAALAEGVGTEPHSWARVGARFAAFLLAGGLVLSLPAFFRSLWHLLTHARVAWSLKQVGKAVLKALCRARIIDARIYRLRVRSAREAQGTGVLCWLEGGTTYEKTLFLEALAEVLDPVEDPRYLLARRGPWGWWWRRDYRAVPAALGQKKELAEDFARMWKRCVGASRLVYTRNPEGRGALLKARGAALSAGPLTWAERRTVWR